MNMDRQDAQDYQHERLLHHKPARAAIRYGLADAQDYRTPDSQNQILYILLIHVNYSCKSRVGNCTPEPPSEG